MYSVHCTVASLVCWRGVSMVQRRTVEPYNSPLLYSTTEQIHTQHIAAEATPPPQKNHSSQHNRSPHQQPYAHNTTAYPQQVCTQHSPSPPHNTTAAPTTGLHTTQSQLPHQTAHKQQPLPTTFILLRSPGIDFKESIPPAWRAGTTTLFLLGS
jgi:hypothetical protein